MGSIRVFIICLSVFICIAKVRIFKRNDDFLDLLCGKNVLLQISAVDVQACTRACMRIPVCVSVFYCPYTNLCQLHDVHDIGLGDCHNQTGVEYWHITNKLYQAGYRYYPAMNSYYKFVLTGEFPDTASDLCQKEGAHLIYIESAEEQDFIVSNIYKSADLAEMTAYWIGAILEGGVWKWGEGGPAVQHFFNNDIDPLASGVTRMKLRKGKNFTWRSSDIISRPYICEVDALE